MLTRPAPDRQPRGRAGPVLGSDGAPVAFQRLRRRCRRAMALRTSKLPEISASNINGTNAKSAVISLIGAPHGGYHLKGVYHTSKGDASGGTAPAAPRAG